MYMYIHKYGRKYTKQLLGHKLCRDKTETQDAAQAIPSVRDVGAI